MLIEGKRINLRLVEIGDADFLLSLRLDPNKSRHLSKVDGDLEKQVQWLKDYKVREDLKQEYYFIVEDKNKNPFGCVRLYDFKEDSFCWGSWILKSDCPSFMAIESALQVYEFAFYVLKFNNCHFDVRKENASVVAFHERFGASKVSEDTLNFYFTYSKDDYENVKLRYGKFLCEHSQCR